MSDKELNRFLADLESDASLEQAVQALRPAGSTDNHVGVEELIALARQRGYEVDMADFVPEVGELDESELAAVVGGTMAQPSSLAVELNPAQAGRRNWVVVVSDTLLPTK